MDSQVSQSNIAGIRIQRRVATIPTPPNRPIGYVSLKAPLTNSRRMRAMFSMEISLGQTASHSP